MAPDTWPAVTTTTIPWRQNTDATGMLSRRAQSRIPTHVDIADVPFIRDAPLNIPASIERKVNEATLAAFAFSTQQGAGFLPFTALLMRGESVASSHIEHLTASAKKIIESDLGIGSSHNADLIVANTRAMQVASRASWPLTRDSLLDMHSALLQHSAPRIAGTMRDGHVWIGGDAHSPAGALYIGPSPDTLDALIDDLLVFIADYPCSPLVKAAIAHAQFETIHPFADGNGRTGRALIHFILQGTGVTPNTALPLSAVLLQDTDAYFAALGSYRNGDVWPIVELFTHCAHVAAQRGTQACNELGQIRSTWDCAVSSRADSPDATILDLLLSSPILTKDAILQAHPELTESRIRRSLARLEAAGVVRAYKPKKNVTAWRADDVLELLDSFAAGLARQNST